MFYNALNWKDYGCWIIQKYDKENSDIYVCIQGEVIKEIRVTWYVLLSRFIYFSELIQILEGKKININFHLCHVPHFNY